MESVIGKPSVRAALRGSWDRDDTIGFALGLGVLVGLAAIDALFNIGSHSALVGSLVAAPLICGLLARAWITLVVGLAALAVAAVSSQWDAMGASAMGVSGYAIAFAIIAVGTALAVVSAWNRRRAQVNGERLEILDAVATFADGSRPLDETLDRVTALIVPSVADICVIDAIHSGGVSTAAVRAAGHPSGAAAAEEHLRRRPLPLPKWLVSGEGRWRDIPRWRPRMREEELRRMARSEEDFAFLSSLGIRSALVVPIAARDRNLGALTLLSAWSGRRYSQDDVRFAQIAARRIGMALDNAGLFSDLQSVEHRLDTVMSIIDEAVTIHARDGEMVFANPAAARAMGFDTPEELIAAPFETIGEQLAVRDESGRPLGSGALAGASGGDGRAPGPSILRVTDRRTRREWWYRRRSQSIEAPDGLPLYLVNVLEEITDVKRAEFSQALLARTGELLASGADYRATLEAVARIAAPELADWCSVSVPTPGGKIEQLALAQADQDRARAAREIAERYPIRTEDDHPIAEVIRTARPQALDLDEVALEALARHPEHLRLVGELGIRSAMLVPMIAGGHIVGVIAFVNDATSRAFDDADLELAVEFGRRAGLALENARIAAERARVADILQRELLPPDLPEMEGWELATMYRPAGEVSQVGGDFYEAFALGDRWAVVLGDITGHGALAASLTAVARHTIRAATTVAADPEVGLRTLDDRLRERDAVALCSVAVLLLPRSAGKGEVEVQIWLAGHPPPFHLRDGNPEPVGTPGPLVGIGERPQWEHETITVAPGEQLVVYTDGVIEARHPSGDRFGIDRLRHRLASCPEPSTAVARVDSALAELASEEPSDDATLVAIRRYGTAPAFAPILERAADASEG